MGKKCKMSNNKKSNCMIVSATIAVATTLVVELFLDGSNKTVSNNIDDKSYESTNSTSEGTKEDVSNYKVVSGNDEEYGFYYEVQLNDSSSIRYYESDDLYEVIEQTDTSTTIETPDYYLVISENGSEVKLKEQDKDVVILDENGGPYLIGVCGD